LAPERDRTDPARLAGMIKALPVPVIETRPIAEAISSAGGIRWSGIADSYMLKALPGTFADGEMLAWEAPTGGSLLTACLA
ncbi:aminoacetone oxidase family FAD-binding enzyme, partial [Rhizobium ruizarguesonis]